MSLIEIATALCPVETRDEALKLAADAIDARLNEVPLIVASEVQEVMNILHASKDLGYQSKAVFPTWATPAVNPWIKMSTSFHHSVLRTLIDQRLNALYPGQEVVTIITDQEHKKKAGLTAKNVFYRSLQEVYGAIDAALGEPTPVLRVGIALDRLV